MRAQVWARIEGWVRAFLDHPYEAAGQGKDPEVVAEAVLKEMRASALGQRVAEVLREYRAVALAGSAPTLTGLGRVGPEWLWRDWRQRLSRGRNHATEERLLRAAWLWTVYRNFAPRQVRREHKRGYPHAGKSPLEVAGMDTHGISYLSALEV